MAKHTHHQSKAEQIDKKAHGAAPFHYDPHGEPTGLKNIQADAVVDGESIQLRAYQIYQQKGGSDVDNWLEAEQFLKNNDQLVLIL